MIVAPSFGLPLGGVERYIEHMTAGLAERNVRVEVVALDPTHAAPPFERPAPPRFAGFGLSVGQALRFLQSA